MNDSDDDSDFEFPSVRRLLPPEYRHKLAEEGPPVQDSTTEKDISQDLDDGLVGYRSRAGSSKGECTGLLYSEYLLIAVRRTNCIGKR
jgi:hypothetical protein